MPREERARARDRPVDGEHGAPADARRRRPRHGRQPAARYRERLAGRRAIHSVRRCVDPRGRMPSRILFRCFYSSEYVNGVQLIQRGTTYSY